MGYLAGPQYGWKGEDAAMAGAVVGRMRTINEKKKEEMPRLIMLKTYIRAYFLQHQGRMN